MTKKSASTAQCFETERPPYKPSPSFQIGTRIFELICNSLTLCLMAVTASGQQHQNSTTEYWVIIGLVVSAAGVLFSGVFLIERQLRFPRIEGIISLLLMDGHLVFVIHGA